MKKILIPILIISNLFFSCERRSTTINLFDNAYLIGEDIGGQWTDADGAVIADGMLDVTDLLGELVFTYTIGSDGCIASEEVMLDISKARTMAGPVALPNICFGENTGDLVLFSVLGIPQLGNDDGVWTSTPAVNLIDGYEGRIPDLSLLNAGTDYTFTYTLLGQGGCLGNDTESVVTLRVLEEILPPTTASTEFFVCEGSPNVPINVNVAAGQSANWYLEESDTDPIFMGASFTPSVTDAGQYNYVVRASDGVCESDEVLNIIYGIVPAPFEDDFQDGFVCLSGGVFANVGIENIQTINSTSIYDFQWFRGNTPITGETGDTFTPVEVGTYYLEYTSVDNPSCTWESDIFEIIGIEEPILTLEQANGEFSTDPTLVATVTNANPNSEYEYILDGGTPQESPVFENVSPGPHTVEVIDLFGCGSSVADKYVIGFPKFFTPNEDGFNDSWNVILDPAEPMNISIFIFDRYGKLLTQVFSTDPIGWDGKFVGRDLPSNDYWFKAVDENTGETRTGHFTLKR